MNIDMLIDGILDSYDRFGGINRNEKENFPNRENVINVLNELQSLIFPGFKIAEKILKNVPEQNKKFVQKELDQLERNFMDYLYYWNEKYYRNGYD